MSKLPTFANIVSFLGAVCTALGLLPFFGIDGNWIWNQLTSMNGAKLFLVVSVLVLLTGLYLKWREKRVTPKNIQFKVRDWCDAFRLRVGMLDRPGTYFGWEITLSSGVIVWVLRTHAHDRYLTFATNATPEDQRAIFSKLDEDRQADFWRGLILETTRSRIEISRPPNNQFGILVHEFVPITPDLSEADVILTIRRMDFDTCFVRNAVVALLSVTQQLSPPITETETPPPSAIEDKTEQQPDET